MFVWRLAEKAFYIRQKRRCDKMLEFIAARTIQRLARWKFRSVRVICMLY